MSAAIAPARAAPASPAPARSVTRDIAPRIAELRWHGARIPSPHRGRGWPASAGRVRGRGFERLLDHRQTPSRFCRTSLFQKRIRRKPWLSRQARSARVALGRVLAAVDFDDQPSLGHSEVDDVAVDLDLLAEFEAVELSAAKDAPELSFGIGRVLAQRCATCSSGNGALPRRPLTPALRADPLPRRGEGYCRACRQCLSAPTSPRS